MRRYALRMGDGTLLIAVFGGLHLLGIAFAMVLLLPLMREEQPQLWTPPPGEDEDGGGGGNDRVSPTPPRDPNPGGLPLPDAVPARVRLRGPGRIADLTPAPARRPEHAPAPTPARTPGRS